ncbi:unnamed protein product [Rotaria sp. Silwood2]|nr:unnamed protein product [Rotaria sp. Silwood2]
MASTGDGATTSDDEESLEDEKTIDGSFRNGEFQGRLFKWTNYLHGWQERYLILRHGFLNYYKNEFDITLGCRGALSVIQAIIQELERRKKFQDLYTNIVKEKIPALGSPDAEEGPYSTLKEDEFFDALDQSLDRIDRETDDLQRLVSSFVFSFFVQFYRYIYYSFKNTLPV